MIQTRCGKNKSRNARGWSFLQTGQLEIRATASVTVCVLRHTSENRAETLQEQFGLYQGSNSFLRAAALIRGAPARMVLLQNIPCRRWLAVLPSGHQQPTLLARGSKAPTEAMTWAWLKVPGQLKQLGSCKLLHWLDCFLIMLENTFLLRLFFQ